VFALYCADPVDYSFLTCSAPDGSWMYVMTRAQVVEDSFLAPTLAKLSGLGFDMIKVRTMPQKPAC